jgi:hypothetical protein
VKNLFTNRRSKSRSNHVDAQLAKEIAKAIIRQYTQNLSAKVNSNDHLYENAPCDTSPEEYNKLFEAVLSYFLNIFKQVPEGVSESVVNDLVQTLDPIRKKYSNVLESPLVSALIFQMCQIAMKKLLSELYPNRLPGHRPHG